MKHTFVRVIACLLIAFTARVHAQDKSAGKTRVACVGDSITYGAGVKDRAKNAYPVKLQEMLGEQYEVQNFGVSGATLLKNGDKPYWKEKAFAKAKDFAPHIVIIKLGTNDSKPQNWKHKAEFAADANALVDEFANLAGTPKVYICRPVPAYPGNWGINDEIIRNELIPILDRVAKEKKTESIDLYTALSNQPKLFPDKVHPNADGALLMAQTIYKALTGKEAPAAAK